MTPRIASLSAAAVLALAALSAALPAAAGPALVSTSGGELASSASDQLYGWRFSTTTALSISALGVYDDDRDGMSVRHEIGIFDATTQALLVSTSLGAGTVGSLLGDYRYDSLSQSFLLQAGSYVIAMTMPRANDDLQLVHRAVPTMAVEVNYLGSAWDLGSVLAFPDPARDGTFVNGMFGPNFLFETVAAVPEPGSFALAGLALFAMATVRRARNRSIAPAG